MQRVEERQAREQSEENVFKRFSFVDFVWILAPPLGPERHLRLRKHTCGKRRVKKTALAIVAPAEIAPAVVVVLPLVQWTPSAVEQARTLWVARQLLASSFDDHEFVLSRGESWDETQRAVLKHADLARMSGEELAAFGALDAPFLAAFSAKVASRRNAARQAVWHGP